MANRQHENRGQQNWPRRSSNERYWENDDERWGSERDRERERGRESGAERYADEYDDGRVQHRRRDTREESGSTGRTAGFAGYGDFGQGDYDDPGRGANTGQGRYGQTGYGQGGYGKGGYGQGSQGQQDYGESNYSSDYGYARGGRRDWESGRGEGSGQGRYGYGGSGLRGSGSGYGSGNWYEPFGEGQQYGRGPYGGSRYGLGEGPHRGKGPKGYQRSDERIKEMICERLREDPDIDASEVSVTVQAGRVTLEGTVDHRGTKNAIEDVAEQLGVSEVQNNLRVQRGGQQGMEQQAGRTAMSGSKSTLGSDDGETSKQKRN